jgi:hypothetical protein
MVRQQCQRGRPIRHVHRRLGDVSGMPVCRVPMREGGRSEVRERIQIQSTNRRPIIATRGANATPPDAQFFKGALFLNTLRRVVNDDRRWWKLIHDYYRHFQYQNIMTDGAVTDFNQQTGMNLTPIFHQYLRHTAIPTLELKFDGPQGSVSYRWKADETDFAMPVRLERRTNGRSFSPRRNGRR